MDKAITFKEALAKQKELDAKCTACGQPPRRRPWQGVVAQHMISGSMESGTRAFLYVDALCGISIVLHEVVPMYGTLTEELSVRRLGSDALRYLANLRDAADHWHDGGPLKRWERYP